MEPQGLTSCRHPQSVCVAPETVHPAGWVVVAADQSPEACFHFQLQWNALQEAQADSSCRKTEKVCGIWRHSGSLCLKRQPVVSGTKSAWLYVLTFKRHDIAAQAQIIQAQPLQQQIVITAAICSASGCFQEFSCSWLFCHWLQKHWLVAQQSVSLADMMQYLSLMTIFLMLDMSWALACLSLSWCLLVLEHLTILVGRHIAVMLLCRALDEERVLWSESACWLASRLRTAPWTLDADEEHSMATFMFPSVEPATSHDWSQEKPLARIPSCNHS